MCHERISRWAGWGRNDDALCLDDRPSLRAYLHKQLGDLPPPTVPVPLDQVRIPPTRLTPQGKQALVGAVGAACVDCSDAGRTIHSVGKSYRDLIAARNGRLAYVTDGVVFPRDERDVLSVLTLAVRHDWAVVPFGGGTGVVGGVEPRRGPHQAVITLDMRHLDQIRLDRTSQLADIGAGAFGPQIEAALRAEGLTLGHFPQSFEFSTFGGWVATRGAGQQSTLYGKIEDMIQAVRMATPAGLIVTRRVPASAAGPSVLQLITGSEGVLGVITSAAARVRPLPECTRFQSYLLADWPGALAFVRRILQEGRHPSVVRLSDPQETRWLIQAGSESGHVRRRIGRTAIRTLAACRGFDPNGACLCLLSFEGSTDAVDLSCRQTREIAAACRAVRLGASPGRSWERDRFKLPYLRDELMARGVMVDTLETATMWSNIERLYHAVREAIDSAMRAYGTPGVVMTHLSHAYPTGASLYYTFLARQVPGHEIEQWQAVKTAATEAIVRCEGTLSHHHGIGYEHLPLEAEHGQVAVQALRTLKSALDPSGLMNPDKLLGT